MIDVIDVTKKLGRVGGAPPAQEGRNVDHVALRVDPFDLEAIRAHLSRFGISASDVTDNYGAEGDGPSVYLRDPEGNTIELKGPARTA
jgi:hypothetical protein